MQGGGGAYPAGFREGRRSLPCVLSVRCQLGRPQTQERQMLASQQILQVHNRSITTPPTEQFHQYQLYTIISHNLCPITDLHIYSVHPMPGSNY